MSTVASLYTRLALGTSRFESGTKRARRDLRQLDDAVSRTKNFVRGLGVTLGAYLGVRAIKATIGATMQAMDEVAKRSDRLNMATESLIGLSHAAQISGVSAQGMDKAIEIMVRRLGAARQGTGEAKKALEMLGLSASALAAQDPAETFKQIAEQIKKLPNQADKAVAAYMLFGRQGQYLLNMLELGAGGIAKISDETKRMGQQFTRIDAAKVEAANDAITRLAGSVRGLVQNLTIGLAPAIRVIADDMSAVVQVFGAFDGATVAAIISTGKWVAAIGALIWIVPKIITAIKAWTAAMNHWIAVKIVELALSGPKGWLQLAAAAVIVGTSMAALTAHYKSVKAEIQDTDRITYIAGVRKRCLAAEAASQAAAAATAAEADRKQSQDRIDAVTKDVRAIEDRIIALQYSEKEILLHKAAVAGLTTKEQQYISALYDEQKALEATAERQKQLSDSYTSTMDALERELAQLYGVADQQLQLFDLQALGATKSQLQEIQSLMTAVADATAQNEAFEKQKQLFEDMQKRAESVWEATRTPIEKYKIQMADLNELVRRSAIDAETYRRAAEQAVMAVSGRKTEPGGMEEIRRAFVDIKTLGAGKQADPQLLELKKQNELQARELQILQRLYDSRGWV